MRPARLTMLKGVFHDRVARQVAGAYTRNVASAQLPLPVHWKWADERRNN